MILKYLLPDVKRLNRNNTMIYPNGICSMRPIRKKEEYELIYEYYNIDLYTANGYIPYLPIIKQSSEIFNDIYSLKNFIIENKIDFYPNWVIAIDRLIRFKKFNVQQAIIYQLNMERETLYKELLELEAKMFPGLTSKIIIQEEL